MISLLKQFKTIIESISWPKISNPWLYSPVKSAHQNPEVVCLGPSVEASDCMTSSITQPVFHLTIHLFISLSDWHNYSYCFMSQKLIRNILFTCCFTIYICSELWCLAWHCFPVGSICADKRIFLCRRCWYIGKVAQFCSIRNSNRSHNTLNKHKRAGYLSPVVWTERIVIE